MHSGVTGGARARPMRAGLDLCDLTAAQFALLFAIFFIVAAVPILVVETVPLFDYPNHLARMHILAQDGRSAIIGRFYVAEWRPIPNLAMDLVVPLLSRVMPLALAGKSFLLAIFLLIAGGTAALHRVLFGRWSAWSLLAFLLLYNRILLWGFVNFLFGVGLLLVALTSWIGLRERAMWQRLAIATGFACTLYLAHLFAFAVYALVVLGYELARLHQQRRLFTGGALAELCASSSQFIPALVVMALAGGTGGAGEIGWSRLVRKLDILFNIVDNYRPWFDIATFALLVAIFVAGTLHRKLAMSRVMVPPLLLLCLAQLAMPNRLFGGTGVDHRMPLILTLLLVAASSMVLRNLRRQSILMALVALLFLARIAVITATWLGYDRVYAPIVAALAALPPGSRLAVATPPASVHISRKEPPMTHLPALAVVTSDAFVPTLFAFPGQQPLAFREPYGALARTASPDDFWSLVADGAANPRAAAALADYDFVLVTGNPPQGPDAGLALVLRASFPQAKLFAVRH